MPIADIWIFKTQTVPYLLVRKAPPKLIPAMSLNATDIINIGELGVIRSAKRNAFTEACADFCQALQTCERSWATKLPAT